MRAFTMLPAVVLTTIVVLAGSCSLPSDDSAQVIAQEDLSPSLQNVSTSPTTSLAPLAGREFAYYLLTTQEGTEQRIVFQVVALTTADTPFEAIDPMDTEGFKEEIGAGEMFNLVTRYDIVDVTVDDGTATVFLETLEEPPDDPVLRDVAAQLVWTLTSESGIERMLIRIDGEPKALPTTNDGNFTDEPVETTDYALYDGELIDDEATTTTSSSSTTTVPANDE